MLLIAEGCAPAYGGCVCACHRTPGMVHNAPCCGPMHGEVLKSIYPHQGPLVNQCPCGFMNGRHTPECPNFFKP